MISSSGVHVHASTRKARGYPSSLLKHKPYDAELRAEYLTRYKARQKGVPSSRRQEDVVTLRVGYSDQQESLGLRCQAVRLIKSLRADIGQGFLKETRIVLQHPSCQNAYVSSYACNFLATSRRGRRARLADGSGGRQKL